MTNFVDRFGNKKVIMHLLFFVVSLVPFLWHHNLEMSMFAGGGDFLSPIQINNPFFQRLYVYLPQLYGGVDFTFLVAHVIFFQGFFAIFAAMGVSSAMTSTILLSIMIYISQISMFFYIEYVQKNKVGIKNEHSSIFSFFAALLYGFSPFIVGILPPGHIIQLFSYMLFPFLILNIDQIFVAKHIQIKNIIFVFLIFFISSPAFANIGMLYVTLLIMFFYCLALSISEQYGLLHIIFRTIVIFTVALSGCIWWLLPHIFTLVDSIKLNMASNVINNAINSAVFHASLNNIFLGRAENTLFVGLDNLYYSNSVSLLLFFGMFILAIIPFLKKNYANNYLYTLLLLLIISAFIAKGTQPPFNSLFDWMYNSIPGFQIFRRPVSKFYWVFLFTFFSLTSIGGSLIHTRYKSKGIKTFIIIFFTLLTTYFIFAFINTPQLKPFNVPNYYFHANDYFKQSNAQRILILPGFYGTYPTYNESVANYYGDDFINAIWNYQILVPDSTSYSINTPTKKHVNNMVELIRKQNNICESAFQAGITHIVVRQDINKNAAREDNENTLITLLKKQKSISEYKEYGSPHNNGFTIFRISNRCVGNKLITSNNKVDYEINNPSTITGHISKAINFPINITLLYNSNPNWRLYVIPYSKKFNPLLALFNAYPEIKNDTSPDSIKNEWSISKDDVVRLSNFSQQTKKNHDELMELKFVFFYRIQAFLYLGWILFLISIQILFILSLVQYVKRKYKKFSK